MSARILGVQFSGLERENDVYLLFRQYIPDSSISVLVVGRTKTGMLFIPETGGDIETFLAKKHYSSAGPAVSTLDVNEEFGMRRFALVIVSFAAMATTGAIAQTSCVEKVWIPVTCNYGECVQTVDIAQCAMWFSWQGCASGLSVMCCGGEIPSSQSDPFACDIQFARLLQSVLPASENAKLPADLRAAACGGGGFIPLSEVLQWNRRKE